jgi:hypothetical protein
MQGRLVLQSENSTPREGRVRQAPCGVFHPAASTARHSFRSGKPALPQSLYCSPSFHRASHGLRNVKNGLATLLDHRLVVLRRKSSPALATCVARTPDGDAMRSSARARSAISARARDCHETVAAACLEVHLRPLRMSRAGDPHRTPMRQRVRGPWETNCMGDSQVRGSGTSNAPKGYPCL